MAKIVIECDDHLVETFCSWFSNQGEQDLFEAHQNGKWNEKEMKWEEQTTYLSTEGYGINEPIVLVEYDKETDEKVIYSMFGQRITEEELKASQEMIAENTSVQLMTSPTGESFSLKVPE